MSPHRTESQPFGLQTQALKAQDEKQLVLKRILAAHEAFFDVHRDYEFAGRSFPGFAEFHSFGEQYVLVKRAKLWEVKLS